MEQRTPEKKCSRDGGTTTVRISNVKGIVGQASRLPSRAYMLGKERKKKEMVHHVWNSLIFARFSCDSVYVTVM